MAALEEALDDVRTLAEDHRETCDGQSAEANADVLDSFRELQEAVGEIIVSLDEIERR